MSRGHRPRSTFVLKGYVNKLTAPCLKVNRQSSFTSAFICTAAVRPLFGGEVMTPFEPPVPGRNGLAG